MPKNNDITLLIGAEFDSGIKESLEKSLKDMGLSAEVSAKLTKDAKKNLLSEIKAITAENKNLAPIDVKARIDSASKKTINQYLKRLKERDVEINLDLSDKSIAALEAKFDSFGAKIAKKISDELAKSLNIKFDTGGLGLKEANVGTKRVADLRESLQKLKGELSGIAKGKYATSAISSAVLDQTKNIDAAMHSGDADKLAAAFGEATEKAKALRAEIAEIKKAMAAIGKRDFKNELDGYLRGDGRQADKDKLKSDYGRIMDGFNKKSAAEQIAAVKELDGVFASYKETVRSAAETASKVKKDIAALNEVLGGRDKFTGRSRPDGALEEYDELAQKARAAKEALGNVTAGTADYDSVHKNVDEITQSFESLIGRVKEYTAKASEANLTSRKEALSNQIDSLIASYPKIANDTQIVAQLRRIQMAVKDADATTLKNLTQEFRNLSRQASDAGLKTESFGGKIKNMFKKFTGWFSVSQIVMQLVNYIRQFGSELIRIDTYLTEISKTSDRTFKELSRLGNAAADVTKKYGATINGYLEGIQEMSRAGYNDKGEAEALAELSLLVQSAGDVTAEVANQFIIATDASYKMNGNIKALSAVLDGANGITNKYAVNLTDIASGMSIAGASAAQFNVKVDELAAAIGTMNAVTQLGGETSARAFRYMMSILSKTSGEIDGEIIDTKTLNKAEAALTSIGVKMTEVRGGVVHLREPMQVLKEVADTLSQMESTDVRRANVLNALGGVNRQSSVAALLSNFDMYERMLSTYAQSAGSAEAEALKTAESIQGRLNNIAATVTQILDNMANSDTIRGVLGFFQMLLEVLEKITSILGSDLGNIGALVGTVLSGGFNIGVDGEKAWNKIKTLGDEKQPGAVTKSLKERAKSVKQFVDELWNGTSKVNAYNDAMEHLKDSASGFLSINEQTKRATITDPELYRQSADSFSEMELAILGTVNASGEAGISLDALGKKFTTVGLKAKIGAVATRALGAALTALISFGIGLAIDGIISGLQWLLTGAQRAAEAAEEARKSISDMGNAIAKAGDKASGSKKKYEELGEAYDKLREKANRVGGWNNLSTSDYDKYVELSEEIISLFPDVDTAFDSNYNRVVTLTDGVAGLNAEYEKLIENQRSEIANSGQEFWKDYYKNGAPQIAKADAMQSFYDDFAKVISGEILSRDFASKWIDNSAISEAFKDSGYESFWFGNESSRMLSRLYSSDPTQADIDMVKAVYGSFMNSSDLKGVTDKAESVKNSLIAKFEMSDSDKQILGENGLDLVRAYISGLTAEDLAGYKDIGNIDKVKQAIYDEIFGGLTAAEVGIVGSVYGDALGLNARFTSGEINVGDYKAEIERIYTELFKVYGDANRVDSILGGLNEYAGVQSIISTIENAIESGVTEASFDSMSIGDLQILMRLVYGGMTFDTMEDVLRAIEADKEITAIEAASSPRNYGEYINGYGRTSAANQYKMSLRKAEMEAATSAAEKNMFADELSQAIGEEIINLEGYIQDIDLDLDKYDLPDEIKRAIERGASELIELGDIDADLVKEYTELFEKRQETVERIDSLNAERRSLEASKTNNIKEFYEDEIAWREELVKWQTHFLDKTDVTDADKRKTYFRTISTWYGAMASQAQGAFSELTQIFNDKLKKDASYGESVEGKALTGLIAQFAQYISEYKELKTEADIGHANADAVAAMTNAQKTLDAATRNREKRVAQNELMRAQGYEVTTIGSGELEFVDAQIQANYDYLVSLKEQKANLKKDSEEYKEIEQKIADAEQTQLGYLQDQANMRRSAKEEAEALVDAQQSLHDELVSQLEEETSLRREKGLATDADYDLLAEQYAKQIEMRQKELQDKMSEMDADMASGKYVFGSQRWLEETLALAQLQGEVDGLIRKEEELARTRLNASINPYENALSSLEAEQARRQSERELLEGDGLFGGSLIYYTAQIKNSKDQIDLLEKINSRKQESLDQMIEEYGEAVKLSDAYREIKDQIDGNIESIISARKAMKDYENAIARAAYVGAGLDAFAQAKGGFSPEQAVASAIEAKEAIEQGFESGYVNSKSFVAAWNALIGDYEKTFSALSDAEKQGALENVAKYLTDDLSGQIQFFEDLSKKAGAEDYFNFADGIAVGLKDVDLEKFVKWSGFTESFVRAMAAGMAAGSPDFAISSDWEKSIEKEESAVDIVDEMTSKVEELAGKNIGDLGMGAAKESAQQLLGMLGQLGLAITNMPKLTLGGVTLPRNDNGKSTQTAMARGTTNARGGRTLVGELGPEIVVSGDEWRLVGRSGAEFTDLKRGDIVFNHQQSEEILRKKNTKKSGGRARALGTAFTRAKAINDGGSVSRITEFIGGLLPKNTSKKTKSGGSGSKEKDTNLDWVDWIEVRLKRLSDITQSWVDAASRAVGYLLQNAKLENAIAAKQDEIVNSEAGYRRYMQQADSVALDAGLKSRVRDGTIDINQYDETTRKLISDYQTWYEKALDCKKAVDELKDAQRELAQQKLENILKHYENRIDRVDSASAKQEAVIDRKIALGREVLASDYEALLDENEKRALLLTEQYHVLNEEFSSLIDRGLIEEGSDAWFEYRQTLAEIDEALIKADIDAQEFRDNISDLALATLEYTRAMLEHTQGTIEQMMKLHEVQKETLTFREYASLIANGMDQIENLGKQIEHFKSLQEGLEIGSDKYHEYQQEIDKLEDDILSIKIAQEEWNDALIDLKIDELEKAREEYEKQNKALEKQLALEEAISELSRAKTQRNKLIYREDGIGYRYEADANAVRDAQKELDKLYHEQMMDKVDEAIDALENLKGDENIYDYDANLIPYEGNLEQHLSQSMADEILGGLQNAGILDVLRQGAAHGASGGSRSVSIAIGDVIVNEANDAGELADAIVSTLPMSIIQKVNTK